MSAAAPPAAAPTSARPPTPSRPPIGQSERVFWIILFSVIGALAVPMGMTLAGVPFGSVMTVVGIEVILFTIVIGMSRLFGLGFDEWPEKVRTGAIYGLITLGIFAVGLVLYFCLPKEVQEMAWAQIVAFGNGHASGVTIGRFTIFDALQCMWDQGGVIRRANVIMIEVLFWIMIGAIAGGIIQVFFIWISKAYTAFQKAWASTAKFAGAAVTSMISALILVSWTPSYDQCLGSIARALANQNGVVDTTAATGGTSKSPAGTPRDTSRSQSTSGDGNDPGFCARLTKLRSGKPTPAGHVGHTGCPGL